MPDFPPNIKNICVYCGSSMRVADVYKEHTIALAKYLVKQGVGIVYGGGKVGLMGLLAETGITEGGRVIGIIPEYLVYKEIQHDHLTEMHVVDSMHTRKKMMVDRSDAFIVMPGGFGTLDESFEIMTWRQLGMHDKPIVFVNVNNYWDPLLTLIDKIAEEKFSGAESHNLFRMVDRLEDIPEALAFTPPSPADPRTKWM